MEETELKIFTLNCWGIPMFSKDKSSRMQAIASFLATTAYDFVCLQEVWSNADFALIRDKLIDPYPYSHYFHSGVIGSGICVFSKHAIHDVFFHQWVLNGYIHKIQHGDWFGGKGVGLCRIKVNNLKVNVYSAHLHAEYNRTNDEYNAHRILQAYDAAQFIQLTAGDADITILGGDLNTQPGDLHYRVLLAMTGFRDAFVESPCLPVFQYTNDTPSNSYTPVSLVKSKYPGKRIDYVLYTCNPKVHVALKNYTNPLPSRVASHHFSYSDHEAVAVNLIVRHSNTLVPMLSANEKVKTLEECICVCNTGLERLTYRKRVYWFLSIFLLAVLVTIANVPPPFDVKMVHLGFKAIVTVLLCYTIVMGTVWDMMEHNGLLAGKLGMQVHLRQWVADRS